MTPENRTSNEDKSARRLVLVMGLLLAVLLGGDWFLRFYWFAWHETIWLKSRPIAETPTAPASFLFTEQEVPPRTGGDLSHLIPIPDVRKRYEERHAGAVVTLDPAGFRNVPYDPSTQFSVVVVGDSYMAAGLPLSNQASAVLSALMGEPILNRAVPGRGPFQSVLRLLNEMDAGSQPPRLVVWGFIEREVSGSAFARFVQQLQAFSSREKAPAIPEAPAASGLRWAALAPASLRVALPNSSAMAQISRKTWSLIQYYGARRLPSEILVLEEAGQPPMLGYGEALASMYWTPAERDLPLAVQSVVFIRDFLAARNLRLIVVPIPDKEQIYRDLIPRSAWRGGQPPYASILPAFVGGLHSNGVPVVDLSPTFMAARARGERLYWRDDTHWNETGIRLAAEEIARLVSALRAP